MGLVSNTSLEEKTFEGFINHLDSIDPQIISDERKVEGGLIQFTSSNELTKNEKEALMKKISSILNKDIKDLKINFVIDPDLIYGYKLNLNTFTVNENLNHYLKDLHQEVLEVQKF